VLETIAVVLVILWLLELLTSNAMVAIFRSSDHRHRGDSGEDDPRQGPVRVGPGRINGETKWLDKDCCRSC
jgi:hypothetical protein